MGEVELSIEIDCAANSSIVDSADSFEITLDKAVSEYEGNENKTENYIDWLANGTHAFDSYFSTPNHSRCAYDYFEFTYANGTDVGGEYAADLTTYTTGDRFKLPT